MSNHHATIVIEEVENGLLINITDDEIRAGHKVRFDMSSGGVGVVDMKEIGQVIKPQIHIANTIEEVCTRLTEYFNYREKV